MASSLSQRPQTTRPRGVCAYYSKPGGCLNGEMCKFLHGAEESLSPYDRNKTCRFYTAGFCKRGDNCWFRHVSSTPPTRPTSNSSPPVPIEPALNPALMAADPEDDEHMCCICQEKPVTYGLLIGCSHICCLQCIRGWRDPHGKSLDLLESGNTKKCPYCRTTSYFVTPSSVFYPSGDPRKEVTIQKYRASMARIQCKYFERSRQRYCPFGRDCFYQHKNRDGTNHIFPFGADYYLERSRQRRRNLFPPADYGGPSPGLGLALAALRERLLTATLSTADDDDTGAFGLLEDILTSFETNPPNDPMSYAAALGVMSSIFDDEDDNEDDESLEDEDENDLPPPLEPFAHVHDALTQMGSPSALPLTRSYMTSVSTSRDPEPRPIVINDPDDMGGVAVTTTVHIHHDAIGETSNGTVGEGEPPYPVGEVGSPGIRTASGTNLSALLHGRSTLAENIPGQPPRPRSALLSYTDNDQDSSTPPTTDPQIFLQQQHTISSLSAQTPPAPSLLSPSIVPTTSQYSNIHNNDDRRSSTSQQMLIEATVPATSAMTTTPPSATSNSVRSLDVNVATTPSSSSTCKESKRERLKSERDRRSFVTDGRGHVVAIAEADPDATPSIFWSQPPITTEQPESGDESGTADSSIIVTTDSSAADVEDEISSS